MTITTETHIRVYDDSEGRYITVRPSADFPESNIMLFVEGQENEDWFGAMRLDQNVEYMRALATAMLRACDAHSTNAP